MKISKKSINESKINENELFNLILDSAPVAFIVHDLDLKIISVNNAYKRITGYNPSDVLGKTVGDVLVNGIPKKDTIGRLIKARDEKIQIGPSEIIGPVMGKKYFSETIIPIINRDNKVVYILTVLEDISIYKNVQEALKDKEEQLRLIADGLPVLISYVDSNEVYRFANREYEKWFGIPVSEFIGKKVRDILGNEMYSRVKPGIETALSGKTASYEGTRLLKDGTVRHFHSRNIPYFNNDGEITGYLTLVEDITDRKNAEEEKKRLESELRHAIKMEAIGTLTGGIAHDFNNILQVLSGCVQILNLADNGDDGKKHILADMMDSIKRGSELVKNLMLFSRKADFITIDININDELIHIKSILDSTLPKNIIVDLKMAKNLKKINADPNQIQQILMNICTNAKDAMPGGGRLIIETKNMNILKNNFPDFKAVPGNYVLLKITDTGIGIDPAIKNKIFDPFFSTKETGKGTGLGLSIVYGIIKNHKGYIDVASVPGEGSSFFIYFPASQRISKEKSEKIREVSLTEKIIKGNEKILIVDDEKAILKICKNYLEHFDYTVILAESGAQCIKNFKNDSGIELIILDLDMPKMPGIVCFRELLKIDKNVKVLISTGYIDTKTKDELIHLGAKDFIEKPFDFHELGEKIRNILGD